MEEKLKINGKVAFQEKGHKYFNIDDESIKYTSVTTLIEKYGQPFNSDFWSKYKALERLITPEEWKIEKKSLLKNKRWDNEILSAYNIDEKDFNSTVQDILDEWQKENKTSCERGTKIHSILENQFYSKGKDISLNKFGIGGKFECKKNYTDLNLEYGVYPEYLIYYDNSEIGLHIAGQIDLLIKSGNDIIIGDHKTNKKIDLKGYFDTSSRMTSKMKYPLTDLEDCNFNHYQLQLSTYAWMLQKLNPEFNIKRLFLNHYDHSGKNTIYECQYLKEDVEKMLKHFVKDQKHQQQKKKYERIEY